MRKSQKVRNFKSPVMVETPMVQSVPKASECLNTNKNRYMHPRNIYRKPPDFTDLAKNYPEFAAVVQKVSTYVFPKKSKLIFVVLQNLSGHPKIDFKDPKAVKALTKCLLKKDFNLDVTLPDDKLIPTLSLRLNYILWLEDILKTFNINENVIGIDIGCGASCIYALVAARKNQWTMYCTEVDIGSIEIAMKNIEINKLESLIHVVEQNDSENIFKVMTEIEKDIHFTMCNPPFFGCPDDMEYQNRSGNRVSPKSINTGSSSEIQTAGGEVEFVSKMIDESLVLKDRVRIYTSMLGKKSSLTALKTYLKEHCVTNVITTEFCQGRTTRWGIAWSLTPAMYLAKVPQYERKSGRKPSGHSVGYTFPKNDKLSYKFFEEILEKLFKQLQIEIVLHDHEDCSTIMEGIALENTWSHQRRKKRQQLKPIDGSNKRPNLEIIDDPEPKKAKNGSLNDPYLVFGACLKQEGSELRLDIGYLEGIAGKDGANQILQYIKNNYVKFIS